MAGVKQLVKQPVLSNASFDTTSWSSGTTSITAVEHFPATVTWGELVAAGFQAGDDVLIQVSGVLGSTNVSGIARCQVGFGTDFAGRTSDAKSLNSIEVAVNQTSIPNGHTFFWMVRRTLVANENIYLAKWSNSESYTCYVEATVQVIRLGDIASNNFVYAAATHTGNAPTAYGTTGASITLPQAGDWIIWGEGYWLDDSTTANATQSLLVGATSYSEVQRQGENVENSWSLGSVYYGTIAASTVCRVQFKVGTASTHDCTESKIFALRLDQFAFHRGSYSTTPTTMAAASTEYTVYTNSTAYDLLYAMPVQLVSAPIFTVTDATKTPRAAASLVLPTSGSVISPLNYVSATSNGTTDKIQLLETAVITPEMWASIWGIHPGETSITFKGTAYSGLDVSPTFTCSAPCFVFWTWDFTPQPITISMPSIGSGYAAGGVVGHEFVIPSLGDTSGLGASIAAYDRILNVPSIAPPALGAPSSLVLTTDVSVNTRQGILQDGRPGRVTYHEPGVLHARNVKQIQLQGNHWSIELKGDSNLLGLDAPSTVAWVYQPPSYDPDAAKYENLLYTQRFGFGNAALSDPSIFTIGFKNAVLTPVSLGLGMQYRQDIPTDAPVEMQLGMVYDQLAVQLRQYSVNQKYSLDAFTLQSSSIDQSWYRGLSLLSWQIDQTYAEYSYTIQESELGASYDLLTIQLNQYPLGQEWVLDTLVQKELSVTSTYDLEAYTVQAMGLDQEWKKSFTLYETIAFENRYDLLTDQGPPQVELRMGWQQHSSRWVTDILSYVNAERLAANKTHQIKYFDSLNFGEDIANRHSSNMAAAHTYAHESIDFPLNWHSLEERKIFVNGASAAAENLQFYEAYSLEDIDIQGVSPLMVHDGWHDSPSHYANYMYEWPAGADVYMLVGIQYFPVITNPPGFDTAPYTLVITQVFVNLGRPENLMLYKSELTIDYQQTGAFIETYEFSWSQDAYKHVSSAMSLEYAIRVESQHKAPWAVRVSAQHVAPQLYSVEAQHVAEFGSTHAVRSSHSSIFDTRARVSVVSSHLSAWGMRVTRSHESEYAVSTKVSSDHSAPFSVLNFLGAQHSSPYSSELRVSKQFTDSYDLDLRNRLAVQMVSSYGILPNTNETEVLDLAAIAQVFVDGELIEVESVDLSTSEDEYVWVANIQISSVSDYSRLKTSPASSVVILLKELVFNMVCSSKTLSREDSVTVQMGATARSLGVALTEPLAETISYNLTTPKMASAVASEIAGVLVQWDIVDWLIPATYFAVEGVTPASAIQTIASAAGGVLESDPDGALRVRYKFPVSVVTYKEGAEDLVLSDTADNLSYGETVDYTDVVDRVRIRNHSDTTADSIEFEMFEGFSDAGVLRVYAFPWREVEVKSTGGVAVSMGQMSATTREEEEVVEMVNGSGSLRYPAASLISEEWKSDSLGNLILDPYTRDIKAPLDKNYGYGLVKVRYLVPYYELSVSFPVGEMAQFIVKDV